MSTATEHEFETFRGELLAHCYRMVGSVHEAEDLVQDTFLRAWQARDAFEGRASVRTWLYKIATNACLNVLGSARRRVLPMSFEPESDPTDPVARRSDVPWLEPLPGGESLDERDSVRLAFVAMAQTLPPQQRAVLLLRDVLGFRAAEVAELLDTTTVAVNSSLRRARSLLSDSSIASVPEPSTAADRRLLDAYVAAWEDKDVPAIVALLTSDAVWEMPPLTAWYRGPAAIGHHLAHRCPVKPGEAVLVPVVANGQPAYATYVRRPDGTRQARFLQVLELGPEGIEHIYAFSDPAVFALFSLPATYEI